MSRRRLAGLVAAWCAMLVVPARADVTATDDAGQHLRLPAAAQRIVSLAPHATELLFAAGAGGQVVGVSAFSDFPEAARQLPKVSGGTRVDLERLVALRPDLVVGWRSGNVRADLDAIRTQGIPIFIAEPSHLDALPATIERLGRLAGTQGQAERAAREFRERLASLRERYRGRAPIRVFLQVSMDPLMTLSHVHMANDIVALCGGRNVFAASELVAPAISREALVVEDPDAILFTDTLGSVDGLRDWWKDHADLRAVRRDRLYSVPADLILRQTPRVLQGIEKVCTALDQARASMAGNR